MSRSDPADWIQPYDEDYGLGIVARHNDSTAEPYHAHHSGTPDPLLYDSISSSHQGESRPYGDPLTPRSNAPSDGMRTRSGRSTRSTESPFGPVKTSVSKSSAPRAKREKKSKLDKSKMPKLTAPLSVLTRDMKVPLKDIEGWVNRPTEQRKEEVGKRNGYITRPMNSFMLYRSAYAERTKQWCLQNNHQIVSSVSGDSWPMEPQEVRDQYDQWAKTERANHQAAHPNYKFSPSKPTNKRRKVELSDGEEDPSDLDNDPDGEYRGSRTTRQRKGSQKERPLLPTSNPFDSHPYYDHPAIGYESAQNQTPNTQQVLPSNLGYDPHGSSYILGDPYQRPQYAYIPNTSSVPVATSSSSNIAQSLGGYGIPGGNISDGVLYASRESSPAQMYADYMQPLYPQHEAHAMQYRPVHMTLPVTPTQASMYGYEHQQYLQQASQPRAAIDPTLEIAMASSTAAADGGEGHTGQTQFDDAMRDFSVPADFDESHEFYVRSTSPSDVNATLAPSWMGERL